MNILASTNDDFNYLLSNIGKDIKINGVSKKGVIGNYSINENFDDKKIITVDEVKRSDLITYGNNVYFIISEVNGTRENTERYKAIMRRCNKYIYFNFNGFIKLFPAIVEVKSLTVENNKYISMPDGTIQVILQKNNDTSAITVNQRFLTLGNAYKVTGIDLSRMGFIILTATPDLFDVNDDRVNEIANKNSYVFTVEITNTAETMEPNATMQINADLKCNGVVIDNPGFTYAYSSSDDSIATISNNGLVTALTEGEVTIIVTLSAENNDTINDTYTFRVENTAVYTISIIGDDSIKQGQSKIYTAKIYLGSEEVLDQTVVWELKNSDDTTPCSWASITSSDGTTATVKAGNTSGKAVKLYATLASDGNISSCKDISITGLW